MITLENQVCSLELAKRLKELGVPQNSLFHWHSKIDDKGNRCHTELVYCPIIKMDKDYSAFTVAELGELLPNLSISSKNNGVWTAEKLGNRCWFEDGGNYPNNQPYGEANTEADARAKCLCFLLENNLLKL